jgi:hypothetical protein
MNYKEEKELLKMGLLLGSLILILLLVLSYLNQRGGL